MATDTPQPFAGRRILVTGAAGAFGSATGAALRDRGASVAGLDVAVPDDAQPGVLRCDVTDDDQVSRRVAEIAADLGGLDALVHFAGIGEPVDAGAAPEATVRRTLDVNLLGPWRVTAAAMAELIRSRGRVVFVASELAYATLPFAGAYAVSKRALAAYADALRLEYGPQVAVTTVYPGYVRTPIHNASMAAGLSLEGQVRAERVEDVVATVLRALAARRPPRDTSATRRGAVELWLARRAPAVVDRVVRSRVAGELRRGRFSDAPLARGLARRYTAAGPPGPPGPHADHHADHHGADQRGDRRAGLAPAPRPSEGGQIDGSNRGA